MFRQSLHDDWQFETPDTSWLQATVPGCIHTDLRRNEIIPDPFFGRNEFDLQWIEERDWNYRLTFSPEENLLNLPEVDLIFEGLDTVATVRLNDEVLLQSENMFHRHRVSVKDRLRAGENNLEISFGSAMKYIRMHRTDYVPPREFNDPVGNCVRIRKEQCQFGWDWGPRFVTCGVWRPVYLEGWSGNRIESVAIRQKHTVDCVELFLVPELAQSDDSAKFRVTVSDGDQVVSTAEGNSQNLKASIENPRLWWPSGHGEQPLYNVTVELLNDKQVVPSWQRRIGLRTIELDMQPDEFEVIDSEGEKLNRFGLRVNGRLIFVKGANWIPAHSFVAGLSRKDYEPLLRSMTAANMNTVRHWGGGIYEHKDFYDLCDELGLLIWHDFMFACTLYPADEAFLASVHREATEQVKRIRHHASLALWCGNNELVALNKKELEESEELRSQYIKLFLETLPQALSVTDPVTPYVHTSPLHTIPGVPESQAPSHDEHDWNVWHNLKPVEYYETTRHRFNSEFGMQSYPSPHVAAKFCPPEELNILSPTFEAHQKHGGGNSIIFNYVAPQFRFPRDYRAISYLSQINQALCMKVAIEHFRRQQPLCLGAMYWQLNDCWPVASWSSIEYGGNWKALQYYARRFFAPAMVSIRLLGADVARTGNRRYNTRGEVELWSVYDAPQNRHAELSWQLMTLAGERVAQSTQQIELQYGRSLLQQKLDLAKQLDEIGKGNALLSATLKDAESGEELSRNIAFFVAPRFLQLKRTPIEVHAKQISASDWELTLSASCFHYGVCIEASDGLSLSDNFFHLLPGERKSVTAHISRGRTFTPKVFSLVDTY